MKARTQAQKNVVRALMKEKTRLLTQAQVLGDMGMQDGARSLWREIAAREEQIAPLLEALGRDREAAVHRISAASSYERLDDYTHAVNLYRAALAGPLPEATRREVEEMIDRCLTRLASDAIPLEPPPSGRWPKGAPAT